MKAKNPAKLHEIDRKVNQNYDIYQTFLSFFLIKDNKTVFDYCTSEGNINGVEFTQANIDPSTGALLSGTENDMLLSLDHEMTTKDEACEDSYYVVFVNPFDGTNAGSPELWIHDRAGSAEVSVKEYVKVVESASPYRVIYSWVVDPVTQMLFTKTSAASSVQTASLGIDADGKITFVSGGNHYNADYTIPVIAL